MGGLSDILSAVKEPAKEGATVKRKHIQFTLEEWQAMEANAGQTLATNDVKAIIQGVFAGKLALSVASK